MWSRVVTVVIVSSLVSSVISLEDLDDNVMPEDSLQDLTVRTKKSPAEHHEKTIISSSESKSDLELKAVLTKDIKRKIDDLKELKNAYRKVEADFFGSESQTFKTSFEKSSSDIESKTPLQEGLAETEDKSVRIARQYAPIYYSDKQYQNQNHDNEKGMFPDNLYSNGKYQSISPQSMDSFGDRDAPYIAQYNPSSRTFGAAGIKGGFHADFHKIPDKNPEVSFHIPAISIKPVELVEPAIPVHEAPPVTNVLPASLPTISVSEHKPHEIYTTKHESNAPLYYEKKEIGMPGSFFSKQIMFGPSKGEGNAYHASYSPYSPYPNEDAYNQPGYSPYSQGYSYGGLPSYLYSSPGYSSLPEAQVNYNYGPAYSLGYPLYQQGQAFYPAARAYRSNRDLSGQFQRYQAELDGVLSQFFRVDSAGKGGNTSVNHSSVEQLTQDIEEEQKRIQILQEELKIPPGSNDGSGVSQSFVNWLSGEVDAIYSRWIHLKDDLTKPKQESGASAKQESKGENITV